LVDGEVEVSAEFAVEVAVVAAEKIEDADEESTERVHARSSLLAERAVSSGGKTQNVMVCNAEAPRRSGQAEAASRGAVSSWRRKNATL
jgi:hypothetical protein